MEHSSSCGRHLRSAIVGGSCQATHGKTGMTLLMSAAAAGHASLVAGHCCAGRALPLSPEGCTALTFAAECAPSAHGLAHYIDHLVNNIPMGNTACALKHSQKIHPLPHLVYNVNAANDTLLPLVRGCLKRCNVDLARTSTEAKADWLTVHRRIGKVQSQGFHPYYSHGSTLSPVLQCFPGSFSMDL